MTNEEPLTDAQLSDLLSWGRLHFNPIVISAAEELRAFRERRDAMERTCLLQVQPGDVLVIRCEHPLAAATKAWIQARWAGLLMDGVTVVVQDNCMELVTLRRQPGARPEEQR